MNLFHSDRHIYFGGIANAKQCILDGTFIEMNSVQCNCRKMPSLMSFIGAAIYLLHLLISLCVFRI